MKTLLTSLLVLLCVSAHGQALRNLNGSGTNTTIYNGLTLTNTSGTATITNIGPMIIRVGANVLGSQFTITDTNGTGRIQLQGHNILLNDTNGNVVLQVNGGSVRIGLGALNGALLVGNGSTDIFAYGPALATAALTNSSKIFAFGDSALSGAALTNASEVYGYGFGVLEQATIRDSSEVLAYGVGALSSAFIFGGSFDIYGYGGSALQGANLTNTSEVFAYGNGALLNAFLTNSSDIYAIGTDAGENLAGSFTHVFLIGSGATATANNQMVFGDSAYTYIFPGVSLIGNGAGLTNLAGATNFNSSVVYNFNGKVTMNAVSYNTNLWAGPTNTLILSTNYQDFIATTDCNITNVGGQLARQNTWATLTISNASAADITVRTTASGVRAQGSGTSAAMLIGAGKEGILSFLSRDFKSTNYVTTAQQ